MNQQDVNHFLQTSRTIAEDLERAGKKDIAQEIINNSSKVATLALQVLKLPYMPFQCPRGHILKGPVSQESYIRYGLCLWCDHLESDVIQERETQ